MILQNVIIIGYMGKIKNIIVLLSLCCVTLFSLSAQEKNQNVRYVTCQIVDEKDSIYIIPNLNYLKGSDYWKWVLNDYKTKKPIKFESLNNAISHLGKFGWKNIREYYSEDKKKHIFVMQREYQNFMDYSEN